MPQHLIASAANLKAIRPGHPQRRISDGARRNGETPRCAHLADIGLYPAATKLSPVRRLLAIFLLAMLPLQFCWAAVAAYCEHEAQGASHFGHHEHPHHAGATPDAAPDANADAGLDAQGNQTPVAMDLDCGHCHGSCGVMLTLTAKLPGMLSNAPPSSSLDEAAGPHAPTRPERPQWRALA